MNANTKKILIGVGVIGAVYFIYKKMKGSKTNPIGGKKITLWNPISSNPDLQEFEKQNGLSDT